MELASHILVGIVAIEHLYILYIEMFSWEKLGKKVFKGALADHLFAPTKILAANQGLYNGFLAAGLIWSLFISDGQWGSNVSIFFLSCVIVAAVYGAVTATKRILVTQGLPAILALIAVLLARFM